jgi:hypothetical protein
MHLIYQCESQGSLPIRSKFSQIPPLFPPARRPASFDWEKWANRQPPKKNSGHDDSSHDTVEGFM